MIRRLVLGAVTIGSVLAPSESSEDAWAQSGAGPAVTASMKALPAPVADLTIPGLRESVEVRRDRWGVPHIYARNQHDLFLAQGFVAAQDRLFQMEMWRRLGEGRLAEVLGSAAVERDRHARLFKYRGDMAREWAAYGSDTRQILTSFVAGVNAYIAMAGDSLPPEFALLGFRPEPWTPEVPLARVTGLSGVSNANSEVVRAALVEKLGAARVDEIMPADPRRALDPAPGLDLSGIGEGSLGGLSETFADVAYTRIEGSNNWVVSGARTRSGRPILANDPHRVITNPAVRYITHLVAPGWNVIGSGEPASPGVAIGHNDRIAFGLTVVGMDQQDVYVEALGGCNSPPPASAARAGPPLQQHDTALAATDRYQSSATRGIVSPSAFACYWYQGGWRPITTIVETVRVKGEPPRSVTLQYTIHGPIVSIDSVRGRAFAIRGVHSEPGTASYLASLALGRARDWQQFQAAMERWLMPSENMLYADIDGNIGWVAGGIMPRRSWSGLLPVPGDGSFEWSGFMAGKDLPRAYNPREGFIATANHNILPAGYTIPISYEWASPYRIDRVKQVLRQTRKFDIDDFKQLQHDDLSLLAQALVPRLLDAAKRLRRSGDRDIQALASWDFRMSRDQVAPAIFAAWAPSAYRSALQVSYASEPIVSKLLGGFPDYEWLERYLSTAGGDAQSDSVLVAALDDGVADLTRRFGSDRANWQWGKIHVAIFRHPLSSKYDLPPASRGGDGNTVNATGGRDFRQRAGASYREIIDLDDFDRSVVTNVPGQSADPRSPHYGDLLPLWASDQYFPLVFSRARVEAETESTLWLRPAARPPAKTSR
ncbi:MAG: Penicillin acylase 2 proenzyme [Gemmatimonadaceae bacterium]|nr:Penicillin acylase 2 proenzyme [Gemmatimonadaceae bacterium]